MLLWWEVGGQQGLELPSSVPFGAGVRAGQMARQQSRAVPFKADEHMLLELGRWSLSLALRASAASLSVALEGEGHTTSLRHLSMSWELGSLETAWEAGLGSHIFPHHPEAEPASQWPHLYAEA